MNDSAYNLTLRQASRYLGLTEYRIQTLHSRGKLPMNADGTFPVSGLAAYKERRTAARQARKEAL